MAEPTTAAGTAGPEVPDAELVARLEGLLADSREQQRQLRTSILRVLDYLEHPSTR